MTAIIINSIGIALIIFIIWWFWFSNPTASHIDTTNSITIYVKDGVYQPAYIEAKINQPITLHFIREDTSPCAEIVIFPALNINQQLRLKQPTDITFSIAEAGEYEFTCQMGMYRGKLIAAP